MVHPRHPKSRNPPSKGPKFTFWRPATHIQTTPSHPKPTSCESETYLLKPLSLQSQGPKPTHLLPTLNHRQHRWPLPLRWRKAKTNSTEHAARTTGIASYHHDTWRLKKETGREIKTQRHGNPVARVWVETAVMIMTTLRLTTNRMTAATKQTHPRLKPGLHESVKPPKSQTPDKDASPKPKTANDLRCWGILGLFFAPLQI